MLRARYPVGKRSHKSHVKGRVFLEFATTLPRCVASLTVALLAVVRDGVFGVAQGRLRVA